MHVFLARTKEQENDTHNERRKNKTNDTKKKKERTTNLALALDTAVENTRDLIRPLLECPVERRFKVDRAVQYSFDPVSLEPRAEFRPLCEYVCRVGYGCEVRRCVSIHDVVAITVSNRDGRVCVCVSVCVVREIHERPYALRVQV